MYLIQQDIINSSIFHKLELSADERWNTLKVFSDDQEDEAKLYYQEKLKDKNLDNKRCPIRIIQVDDDVKYGFLTKKGIKD